jgi:hypothetical protein
MQFRKMSAKQMNNAAEVGRIKLAGFWRRRLLSRRLGVQRMWLTAAGMGIAVHPMTALTCFLLTPGARQRPGIQPKRDG